MSLVEIFKALGEEHRLKIFVALVNNTELCACDIAQLTNLASSTISKHMSILKYSGLVKSRKDSRWVYFFINKDCKYLELLKEMIKDEKVIVNKQSCSLNEEKNNEKA